jgi:hypothetical protein
VLNHEGSDGSQRSGGTSRCPLTDVQDQDLAPIRSTPRGCSVQVATGRPDPASTALLRGPVRKCRPACCDELAIPAWLAQPDIRSDRAAIPNKKAAEHDKAHPSQDGVAKQPGLYELAELPKEGGEGNGCRRIDTSH